MVDQVLRFFECLFCNGKDCSGTGSGAEQGHSDWESIHGVFTESVFGLMIWQRKKKSKGKN